VWRLERRPGWTVCAQLGGDLRAGIYGGVGLAGRRARAGGERELSGARETSRSAGGQYRAPALTDGADKPGRRTEWLPFFITTRGHGPMVRWFPSRFCLTHAGDSAAPRRTTGTTGGGSLFDVDGVLSGLDSQAHRNRTETSQLHAKTVCCSLIGTEGNAPLAPLWCSKMRGVYSVEKQVMLA